MKLPKMNLSGVVRNVQKTMGKHAPQILTGVGIAGMLTTVVLAVRSTPKALNLMDEKKKELNTDKLTPVETVKATWKCYAPAVVTGIASTACIIGGVSIGARRTAALATAYKISETALHEYKDKVVETIGEKKEKVISEKVAQDKIDKDPVVKKQIIMTGGGDVLCYDPLSGRYFMSSMEKIREAKNSVNELLIAEMYASLNDFYDCIGLGHTKLGEDLGWNIDSGTLQIDFDTALTDKEAKQQGINDGTPCLVLDYNIGPRYDFNRLCY